MSDSRFRPLVMKEKPWVSIATPVLWTCSSTYLKKQKEKMFKYKNHERKRQRKSSEVKKGEKWIG